MLSIYHCIWMAVCAAVILSAVVWLKKNRPDLRSVLSVACVLCVLSELTKTLSVMRLIPSADGSAIYPYLEMKHLPLHLCSIQILIIFFVRFAKDSKFREALLAFMYPTCLLGALLAILMPSIFPGSILPSQAFVHPLGYQYFLYHAMLIILGIYIPMSGQVDLRPKHYVSTLGILGGLAFLSIYLNSMFAVPVYEGGKLVSVEYTSNFFFTYKPPLGIKLTQLWHWYVYMGVILLLGVVLIGLLYLLYFKKGKK